MNKRAVEHKILNGGFDARSLAKSSPEELAAVFEQGALISARAMAALMLATNELQERALKTQRLLNAEVPGDG